jgi:hypothetical protein
MWMNRLARSLLLSLLALAFLAQGALVVWLLTTRAEQQAVVDEGILLEIRQGHARMEATFKDKCSIEGNNLVDAIGTVRAEVMKATEMMSQCAQVTQQLSESAKALGALETTVDALQTLHVGSIDILKSHFDDRTQGMALEQSVQRVLSSLACESEDGCFDSLVRLRDGAAVLRELATPNGETALVKALGIRMDDAAESLRSATSALQEAVDVSALVRTELQKLNEDDAAVTATLGATDLIVDFAPPALLACEDVEVALGVMSTAGNKPTYPVTLGGGAEAVNLTDAAIADLEGVTGITMRRNAARVAEKCVAAFSLGPNARTWFGMKKAAGRSLWVQMALVSRGAYQITPIK